MIAIHPFVNRQTPASRFSHFEGDAEELIGLVKAGMPAARKGYREGVFEVPVPPEGFFSGVVTLEKDQKMVASYESRREGEEPRKVIMATGGQKMPARSVNVIVYASAVLAEGGDNTLPNEEGNMEIISINASPCEGREPINPEVLMHNHFGSSGGTATKMSDEEFVATLRESFLYWKDKAMLA